MSDNRRPSRTFADVRNDGESEALKDQRRVDSLYWRVFRTPDGQELLAHMRKHTIDKRNAPDAPESALRWSEAQRSFVATIEGRIARCLENRKPKATNG